MNNSIDDKTLQQQVESLPESYRPNRDLWPGIEKAIYQRQNLPQQEQPKQYAKAPLAWAASIVVAVMVTWLGVQNPQTDGTGIVQVMQDSFAQEKQLMLTSFGNPEITALPDDMLVQLSQLASARASIVSALESDPQNKDLMNLLRFTQQQELDLLQKLYATKWQSI